MYLPFLVSCACVHVHLCSLSLYSGVPLTHPEIICDVLTLSGFLSSSWQELALRLGISDPVSITEQKPNSSLCLQEAIHQWLQMDPDASWEVLSEEVSRLAAYGSRTKMMIRRNAGIGF